MKRRGHSPVMARKLRVEYPGAVYRVMNRGDRRESIFRDNADRQRFVETMLAQKQVRSKIMLSIRQGENAGGSPIVFRTLKPVFQPTHFLSLRA